MNEQIKAGADQNAGDGGYREGTQEDYEAFVKERNKSLSQSKAMRYWTIVFPGEHNQHVQETWSEDQIIASYYQYWANKCINAVVNPDFITRENCIHDWRVVHWAMETDEFGVPLF